jgi:hypothetical protein
MLTESRSAIVCSPVERMTAKETENFLDVIEMSCILIVVGTWCINLSKLIELYFIYLFIYLWCLGRRGGGGRTQAFMHAG